MRLLANDLGPAKIALLAFNSVSSPIRFPCNNSK